MACAACCSQDAVHSLILGTGHAPGLDLCQAAWLAGGAGRAAWRLDLPLRGKSADQHTPGCHRCESLWEYKADLGVCAPPPRGAA